MPGTLIFQLHIILWVIMLGSNHAMDTSIFTVPAEKSSPWPGFEKNGTCTLSKPHGMVKESHLQSWIYGARKEIHLPCTINCRHGVSFSLLWLQLASHCYLSLCPFCRVLKIALTGMFWLPLCIGFCSLQSFMKCHQKSPSYCDCFW